MLPLLFTILRLCESASAKQSSVHALVVIDVQNCFLPGGSLAITNGDSIIPVINDLVESNAFNHVVWTQDWHTDDHISFAQNHHEKNPFTEIVLNYDTDSGKLCQRPNSEPPFAATYHPVQCTPPVKSVDQMLWPKHCVENTEGADFGPGLKVNKVKDIFVKKGNTNYLDSYSAFFDNGGFSQTTLGSILKTKKVTHTYFVGLATDYCVQFSAQDSKKLGFDTTVITDATLGVDVVNIRENILPQLTKEEIKLKTSTEVIQFLKQGSSGASQQSAESDSPLTVQMGPAPPLVSRPKSGGSPASSPKLSDNPSKPLPPQRAASAPAVPVKKRPLTPEKTPSAKNKQPAGESSSEQSPRESKGVGSSPQSEKEFDHKIWFFCLPLLFGILILQRQRRKRDDLQYKLLSTYDEI